MRTLTLNLLRRYLHSCSEGTRDIAYKTMVRPILEYAAGAWDPYQDNDIKRLQAVQNKAARFVTGKYQREESVTDMLKHLQWRSLQQHRLTARLAMFHKIRNKKASCVIPPQFQQ